MPVVRTSERCAATIREALEALVGEGDYVEFDVCTTWAEWICGDHESDDEHCDGEHEPHPAREQVLALWIALAAPETESTSTCQWIMPLRAATNDFIIESLKETLETLSFARRAHELQGDIDLDDLADQLDEGQNPGQ